jgi:hypothetical protein
MNREIPPKFWESFCQQLKALYRGAISIRWIQPGGILRIVAENIPLQSLVFQKQKNACDDIMTVKAGEPDTRPVKYEILEPFRIVLRKDEETGRYNELEILAETGKTEITFIPGIDARLLEELAA